MPSSGNWPRQRKTVERDTSSSAISLDGREPSFPRPCRAGPVDDRGLPRSFSWGHCRQLDEVAGEALRRAWAAGAGPGDAAPTVDVMGQHLILEPDAEPSPTGPRVIRGS